MVQSGIHTFYERWANIFKSDSVLYVFDNVLYVCDFLTYEHKARLSYHTSLVW